MDPELIAYLDERFREAHQQIEGLRAETNQRFDQVEKRILETDIKVEGLRDNIRQVAEGVAMANQKLDLHKEEVAREFSETKALIHNGYRDLDRRVKVLERRRAQS